MDSVIEYARFLERVGHNVIEIDGTYWFNSHSKVYQSFPFHHLQNPKNIDLSSIFKKGGIVGRFSCPVESGRASYRISINNSKYDLNSLNVKARNQTRRGLENCIVRQLTPQEISKNALQLNQDTLERQGRVLSLKEQSYWRKFYSEIALLKTASIWGAFVGNELASFLISVNMDKCENILIVRSKSSMLKYYPNNAMIFQFVSKMIIKDSINEISIGLESIQSNMDSLDRFKLGMGFKKIPIGQFILFKPPFSFLFKGRRALVIHSLVGLLFKKKSEKICKIQGLLLWFSRQK